MATALRESLASNCRSQRLFLVGVLIVLISPTLTTAEVIFHDDFDGFLATEDARPQFPSPTGRSNVWVSDWNSPVSQGYDGTNDAAPDPVPCPFCSPPEPGGSLRGCNVENPFDDCGPDDPPTEAGFHMNVPRTIDEPGKMTTGVRGWTTLRADPVNPMDPPGCDPTLDECGPCDPATQNCYKRADGTLRMTGIDISNVETAAASGNPGAGVHMGVVGRFQGTESGTDGLRQALYGAYLTAFGHPPQIFIQERLFSSHSASVSQLFLPHELESPIHMELTIEGGEVDALVTFTIGDADEEYTISTVNGTHEHVNIPGLEFLPPHFRPIPDPGRWGFFSHAGGDPGLDGTDWTYWGDFCFTDVGETCGVQTQPGDHDGDGDVDGNDFLGSQLLGASAISDWKGNYPIPAPLSGVAVVPEPSTLSLCVLAAFALWPTRRQRV